MIRMKPSFNLEQRRLLSLLHLSDPTLPIGAYSHSSGLETYVQQGMVHDVRTTEEFVRNMLGCSLKFNDAAFVCLAYRNAMINELEEIFLLDQECTALKMPEEIRMASRKLGMRLIKIFNRQQAFPLVEQYERALQRNEAHGHYSIVYGMYAAALSIPLAESLTAYYYNAAVSLITNAVKLVPLGQLDGQDILYRCHALIETLVPETMELDRSLVGRSFPGFDLACMQHERLYSRLFMS